MRVDGPAAADLMRHPFHLNYYALLPLTGLLEAARGTKAESDAVELLKHLKLDQSPLQLHESVRFRASWFHSRGVCRQADKRSCQLICGIELRLSRSRSTSRSSQLERGSRVTRAGQPFPSHSWSSRSALGRRDYYTLLPYANSLTRQFACCHHQHWARPLFQKHEHSPLRPVRQPIR